MTEVRVVRSPRRRRTASARWVHGILEVRLPQRLDEAAARQVVARLVGRMEARRQAVEASAGGEALLARCRALSERYLGGQGMPRRVVYVPTMTSRWASITPSTGEMRLSVETRGLPGWVRDYLLLHEMAHLLVPGHGRRFWELLGRYPRTERARGYLMALGERRGRGEPASGPEGPGRA